MAASPEGVFILEVIMAKVTELSVERWKSLFRYENGELYWKERGPARPVGRPAGRLTRDGYVQVSYKGRIYRRSHVVMVLHGFEIPEGFVVDHIDGNKSNDKIHNLRLATYVENSRNAKHRANSSAPYKGITLRKNGRWGASIFVGGQRRYLGSSTCPLTAHRLYCKAAKEYFGEFAREV